MQNEPIQKSYLLLFGKDNEDGIDIEEQKLINKLVNQYKILTNLHEVYSKVNNNFEGILTSTDDNGRLLIDTLAPFETLKLFTGLEIHNLQKAFQKFEMGITLDAFVLIGLEVLDVKPEVAVFVTMSLIEIFDLLQKSNYQKQIGQKYAIANPPLRKASFTQFINLFIKNQTLMAESKNNSIIEDPLKKLLSNRIKYSKCQDVIHHDTQLKDAYYSESLGYLFSLDDNSDNIRAYDNEAIFKFKIYPQKDKHQHFPIYIINFAWSETQKIIGACLQDNAISFFDGEKFANESTYRIEKLQVKVWCVDIYQKWLFVDIDNQLSLWDAATHKLLPLNFPRTAKVTDIVGIPPLRCIGISTFDHVIIFLDYLTYNRVFTISLKESSAHTIKYSNVFSLFLAATFENTVRCYNVDTAKDLTKVGKFEHLSSITAIEIMDDYGVILTCDEEGYVKAWDPKTYKSIQNFQVRSKNPVTKILMLKKTNKFCVLANRLQFFEFSQKKVQHEVKIINLIPCMIYSQDKEILTLATAHDLRSYNIKYGVLTELYSSEAYEIKNKIVCVKYSKKQNVFYYSNELGQIKQILPTEMLHMKVDTLQPFPNAELEGIIWNDRYELMLIWSKSILKIYKFDALNTNNLIRQINFPSSFTISQIKLNKKQNFLFIILNSILILTLDFQKLALIDCLIMPKSNDMITATTTLTTIPPATISPSMQPLIDQILERRESQSGPNTIKIKKKNLKSLFFGQKNEEKECFSPKMLLRHSRTIDEFDEKEESIPSQVLDSKRIGSNSGSPISFFGNLHVDSKILNNVNEDGFIQKTGEIDLLLDNGNFCEFDWMLSITNWECLLVIENNLTIHLVKTKNFAQFEINLRLEFPPNPSITSPSKINEDLFSYTCCKVKSLPNKPTNDPKEGSAPQKVYILLGSTTGYITLISIYEILEGYFNYNEKERIIQPFHKCDIVINEMEINNIIKRNLSQFQKQMTHEKVIKLDISQIKSWKAHQDKIINCKIIESDSLLVLSIEKKGVLKIWNINSELLAIFSLNDPLLNKWNLMTNNSFNRLKILEKLKSYINSLATRYPEIKHGIGKQSYLPTKMIQFQTQSSKDLKIKKGKTQNFLYGGAGRASTTRLFELETPALETTIEAINSIKDLATKPEKPTGGALTVGPEISGGGGVKPKGGVVVVGGGAGAGGQGNNHLGVVTTTERNSKRNPTLIKGNTMLNESLLRKGKQSQQDESNQREEIEKKKKIYESYSPYTKSLAEKLEEIVKGKKGNMERLQTKNMMDYSEIKSKILKKDLRLKLKQPEKEHIILFTESSLKNDYQSPLSFQNDHKSNSLSRDSYIASINGSKANITLNNLSPKLLAINNTLRKPEKQNYIQYYMETSMVNGNSLMNVKKGNIGFNEKKNSMNIDSFRGLEDTQKNSIQNSRESSLVRGVILANLNLMKKKSQNSNSTLQFRMNSQPRFQVSDFASILSPERKSVSNYRLDNANESSKIISLKALKSDSSPLLLPPIKFLSQQNGSNRKDSTQQQRDLRYMNAIKNPYDGNRIESYKDRGYLIEEMKEIQDLHRIAGNLLVELNPLENLIRSLDKQGIIQNKVLNTDPSKT